MATAIEVSNKVIGISGIDADVDVLADAGLDSASSKGLPILCIRFMPGAADDVLVVKEGADDGPVITKLLSTDGEIRADGNFDGKELYNPVIDESECTLTAGALVTITYK
jgi:hypothetical protein